MRTQDLISLAITLVIMAVIFVRASRPRRVRLNALWIAPLFILAAIAAGVAFTPHAAPFTPPDVALFAGATALGAAVGWWRAKAVRLSVDPATQAVTSTVSPVGLAIIAGVFVIRFGLRSAMGYGAGSLRMDPAVIGDAFLLLAGGLVVAQRTEIAIRARRLLAAASPAAAFGAGEATP